MRARNWWDLAVGAAVLVVATLVWFNSKPSEPRFIGIVVLLLAVIAVYAALGRRALKDGRHALAFQLLLTAFIIAGAWFAPDFVTLQVIVLPLIWATALRTRTALILNVVVAVGITVTFALGLGGSADSFVQGGTIEALSLMFSLALGLWIGRIQEYGQERARLLDELTAAQGDLERVNRDTGAIQERERMAREIHDTLAQSLTGLVMLTQRARRELGETNETLILLETMTREALGEARALVATSAGIAARDGDLAGAIQRLGIRFERETGIRVDIDVAEGPMERDIEVVLLRCVQEAFGNVRKHSGAAHVSVLIRAEPDAIALTVSDDGRGLSGYDPSREQGFGLSGMRDRIGLVGGELELADAPGGGAVLHVRIPVPDSGTDDATPGRPGREAQR